VSTTSHTASSLDAERLYALLPAVYRVRDAEQGYPLRALVGLVAHEFEALEEDVHQLHDDQFIETCAEWVAPYIGDLIGYRPLHGVVPGVASPRAEVANTIAYRRRKGTAAMLEQLARDVTGWPARAVEFFQQLATTQYMNHPRLHAQAVADLRSQPRLLALREQQGAFNLVAHTAEMRRPDVDPNAAAPRAAGLRSSGAAARGAGRFNIRNVGLFLWRLEALAQSRVPLTPHDNLGRKFRFNPLGADQPLFRRPLAEDRIDHIAEPAQVPAPLTVRAQALALRAAQRAATGVMLQAADYGVDASFVLLRGGQPVPLNRMAGSQPVPEIFIADLRDIVDTNGVVTGWAHEAGIGSREIRIDPERGRVLLGASRATEHAQQPFVGSCHRGFSRRMGGGEYEREPAGNGLPTTPVIGGAPFQAALTAAAPGGRVLLRDNLVYGFTPVLQAAAPTAAGGGEVVVAAINGARPVILAGGAITCDIGPGARLVIDGLVIAGHELVLPAAADNQPRELVLRHCTLVPGRTLLADGAPAQPGVASLRIEHPFARVVLEDCIVGAIRAHADAEVTARGCIVDANAADAVAFEGLAAARPGAALVLEQCTVVGKVATRRMTLASNTLFAAERRSGDGWRAPVWAEQRQQGCTRFCLVPPRSLVPRPHGCLPDAAHPDVRAHFTSLRSHDPGYAQLRAVTDAAIRTGADDGSEIGAMHALHQPQREANLRQRLDEYLRYGLAAGFVHVT